MIFIAIVLLFSLLIALVYLRYWDSYQDRLEWQRLSAYQPVEPQQYHSGLVADLPAPVRQFFEYVIQQGTPLNTVAEIEMGGEFSLGNLDNPGYRPMVARQILAAPAGFVWQAKLPGLIPVSGSDTGAWTRFRILGLLPVARKGGDADHARSAFGRYVAEAVFWTPAALLPGPGITWEASDHNTARVTVTHQSFSQTVDIMIDKDGCPNTVQFMRWSNANSDKKHRLQPFGGHLSDFRDVDGFRVPFSVEAGNMFATDEEFVFFKAKVHSVRYPKASDKAQA